jgi:hypothetical protein
MKSAAKKKNEGTLISLITQISEIREICVKLLRGLRTHTKEFPYLRH